MHHAMRLDRRRHIHLDGLGDATRTDELPINDSTRPSHFEGVNNAVMEADDAEASGMDEPWRGVADTAN